MNFRRIGELAGKLGLNSKTDPNEKFFFKNKVLFKRSFNIRGQIYFLNLGEIVIGENFTANSGEEFNLIGGDTILRLITFTKQAKIILGDNIGISNSTLVAWNSITIENNVLIGGGVKIWDTDFHSLDPTIRVNTTSFQNDVNTRPVLIKENAFIGALSIILKGVTIGRNSIIGAGSVVTKDIPDNVIAAGNPCKVIKAL